MKMLYFQRGSSVISNWPFWIMFALAVGAVGIIIVKIANVNVAEASKIPLGVEDEIALISRFYSSGECFAYEDDVGRVYPKVIDAGKFNDASMDVCFSKSSVKYAYLLKLEQPLPPGVADPIWTFGTSPVKTFNWPGGFAEKEIIEDVLVIHNGDKHNGILRIQIKNVG